MGIILLSTFNGVMTQTKTTSCFKSSEFKIWEDEKGNIWVQETKGGRKARIGSSNVSYILYEDEVALEAKPKKGRPANE